MFIPEQISPLLPSLSFAVGSGVILLPLIYYGGLFIYNVYFHPLSTYPGPWLSAGTNWSSIASYIRGDGPAHYLELHNRYGPVVRTSPDELSFIDPAQWKEIYGHRQAGQLEFPKDKKYHSGADREPSILNANQEYHRYIRRLLAHGFSDKSLREQETILQECVNTLFQKLHENGKNGKVAVNLVPWYSEQTRSRIKNGSPVPDFMEKLIETHQSGKISFESLVGNAETLLGAGSETTATLLSGLTYLLTKHPEVRERLTREIRSTFQSPEEITITGTNQCKYLFACIEEALRLYAPSPQPHQRIVPRGGAVLAGKFLPAGVVVSIPIYAAARSPWNWARPDEFVPERWMGEGEKGVGDQFKGDAREASQPFSYGPRNCLGKNLAYVEMKVIMARLVWHFDVELENNEEDDWFDQRVYVVWEKKPLWVKLHPVQRG